VIQVNSAHRLGKVSSEKGLKLEIDPLNRQELALLLKSFKNNCPRLYTIALTMAQGCESVKH
jgi:hypothetical protein